MADELNAWASLAVHHTKPYTNCNFQNDSTSHIAQNSATHPGPLLDAGAKFESQLGKARVKQ